MNDDGKRSQGGGWLIWVGLGMYALSGELGLAFARSLSFGDYPGSDIPWYFIRRDYILGIVMGIGGLTCILLGLAFLKLYRSNAKILIAQSFIWFGYPAWKAAVIALRSDHVLSLTRARTAWSSFEAYERDPWIWRGFEALVIAGLLALAISLGLRILERRRAARVARVSSP